MKRIIRRGDFILVIEGWRAKVYDRKSRKKLFEGSPERVFRELQEKIEGSLSVNGDFDFFGGAKRRRRRRDLWEF